MPFQIIRDDITRVKADAIVNTANPEPRIGAGTDAAVYKAAGVHALLAARRKIGRIAPGKAAATAAFRLPAKYLIHTVGPMWIDGKQSEAEILRSCYRESLLLAQQLGCKSVAFPLISAGVYGFPKDLALEIALSVFRTHLETYDLDITLVVFENEAYAIAAGLTRQVEAYIDAHYVEVRIEEEYSSFPDGFPGPGRRSAYRAPEQYHEYMSLPSIPFDAAAAMPDRSPGAARPAEEADRSPAFPIQQTKQASLEDAVNHLGESFQKRLLRMIDERGMTDPEVYKRANIDRKLFSKIRCNENYIPKKKTIVALAIALRLNLDDTKDLLAGAGLVLTNNSKADVIVSFCIEHGIYDIFEVNALLFRFDQPILG